MRNRLAVGAVVVLCLAGCGEAETGHPAVDAAAAVPDGGGERPDAGSGAAVDPALAGPYAVHLRDDVTLPGGESREVTATLCAPSSDGGASVAAGPFPLIVVSPGFQMERTQYLSYCEHFASWGLLAILQTYSEDGFFIDHEHLAADISSMIDWAIAGGGDAFTAAFDRERIGAAGHSLGGKVSLLAAADDHRIGAVAAWDPVDAGDPSVTPQRMDEVEAALALAGETLDGSSDLGMPCAPADENFRRYFAGARGPAYEHTVIAADHMDWVDDPGCALCGFCRQGAADPAAVRAHGRGMAVALFRRHLLDDVAMASHLDGDAVQAEVAAGRLEFRSKP